MCIEKYQEPRQPTTQALHAAISLLKLPNLGVMPWDITNNKYYIPCVVYNMHNVFNYIQ
jgi:hypothetical protein